jgi:ATP-dependent helicase YprA (DUF1998 family)
MNAVKITQKLEKSLVDYLSTTFDPNKDGKEPALAYEIRKGFSETASLFKGPFLEIIHPYKVGENLQQLADRGVISNKLLNLPCFNLPSPKPLPSNAPLYSHQQKAIEKIITHNRSVVVSSGTGSGKTEAFLIPILNDLCIDSTPGVRALIIYPLNALVNDQLERLREILKGTNITFGRYTGELKDKELRRDWMLENEVISREEIRVQGKMPQILITNYAMLEYLLLRPEDSELFGSGLWKYLVLDEAHTYNGAQGIEVSMLIRRLKERLHKKPGDMTCIATSATLVNESNQEAVVFAQNLFGEEFTQDDIIMGEEIKTRLDDLSLPFEPSPEKTYLHPKFDQLIELVRTNEDGKKSFTRESYNQLTEMLFDVGLVNDVELISPFKESISMSEVLYKLLKDNPEIRKLKNWLIEQDKPADFNQASDYMFHSLLPDDRKTSLYHLIEIGASARKSQNSLPFLPIKYHLFARPPQGVWVCINPDCPGKQHEDTDWSKVYSHPLAKCEVCGASVYPLYLCRECGQHFIVAETDNEGRNLYPAQDIETENMKRRYLTWSKIIEDRAIADNTEESEEDDPDSSEQSFSNVKPGFIQEEFVNICLECGSTDKRKHCGHKTYSILLWEVKQTKVITRRGLQVSQVNAVDKLNECPRCRAKSKSETEIATAIVAGGTGPLGNLTYELYRELPVSPDPKIQNRPGEGRKLLTFYDSRQGAARFAAYLQDITNKQIFRHILPIAIKECKKPSDWDEGKSPNLFSLSEMAGKIALKQGVLTNDLDFNDLGDDYIPINKENLKKASIKMAKIILGEFTTGRRSRQSLESIGSVGMFYFNDDDRKLIEKAAEEIGLNGNEFLEFISTLLDDMRFKKAIKLPDGVMPDDEEFGLNKGNPFYIRAGVTTGQQLRWIGRTDRPWWHRYTQIFLQKSGRSSSMEDVRNLLNKIWELLSEKIQGLFTGSPQNGYQLDPRHIYFENQGIWSKCKRCQRLSYRSSNVPCGSPNCGGELEIIDLEQTQENNYYYQGFKEKIIPIRVEEHTAQISPEKGQEYQKDFKNGKINVLSCSTTFEMGVNLGDLQAVSLSNVPPTVANYRQRAGRAGRNLGGTSYIMTWASDRPHDQAYYDDPSEIINGEIQVPKIVLSNELIARRHVNALLLGDFLKYRNNQGIEPSQLKYCREFFNQNQLTGPHIDDLDKWKQDHKELLKEKLTFLSTSLPEKLSPIIQNGVEEFIREVLNVYSKKYKPLLGHYNQRIAQLSQISMDASKDSKTRADANSKISYFQRLILRLEGEAGSQQGLLIDYLSNMGVLPSYSFPLNTVELMVYKTRSNNLEDSKLRLERDLRQAIREYAPGSEIVANKRIWKSQKPLFWNDTPEVLKYRICHNCHNLEIAEGTGISLASNDLACPVCGEKRNNKDKIKKYVVPDAFLADPSSGKPAKQYVFVEQKQIKSALIPESNLDEESIGNRISVAFNEAGRLLYVNEGKFGSGYPFSISKFDFESNSKGTSRYSLGFQQTTNTLHIRFLSDDVLSTPPASNRSFWLSLLYAIIQGACHVLQIERRDINGVLFPSLVNGKLNQTLVIYDNVPGGAGHVKNIKDNLLKVLSEASRTLNCDDCAPDTSCYHCLKDYDNQYFHSLLKREEARDFLELVLGELEPVEDSALGAYRIASPNLNKWITEKIKYATSELYVAVDDLMKEPISSSDTELLDLINDALLKNVNVNLGFVKPLPHSPEGNVLKEKLKYLKGIGLRIYMLRKVPQWELIIDPKSKSPRAIQFACEQSTSGINLANLISTVNSDSVRELEAQWKERIQRDLSEKELVLPENTSVIRVSETYTGTVTEKDYFNKFFSTPVKKMIINDPYLTRDWVIKKRLNAYIELANSHNTLEEVIIHTRVEATDREQASAFEWLKSKYPGKVVIKGTAEHDRSVVVTRITNEKARIIIGRGLDFIDQQGRTKSTFIIIEDPIKNS